MDRRTFLAALCAPLLPAPKPLTLHEQYVRGRFEHLPAFEFRLDYYPPPPPFYPCPIEIVWTGLTPIEVEFKE
jgi:hypothetical protein